MEEDYNRDNSRAWSLFDIGDAQLGVGGWTIGSDQKAGRAVDDDVNGEDTVDGGGVGRDFPV